MRIKFLWITRWSFVAYRKIFPHSAKIQTRGEKDTIHKI
ncbi:hypothetical protein SAMN05443573_102206 [Celeribacter indicus]|nr:hypothetical protein SAMN05443573_102206 [Celeribacter indicus]